jgi:hypothetical protein
MKKGTQQLRIRGTSRFTGEPSFSKSILPNPTKSKFNCCHSSVRALASSRVPSSCLQPRRVQRNPHNINVRRAQSCRIVEGIRFANPCSFVIVTVKYQTSHGSFTVLFLTYSASALRIFFRSLDFGLRIFLIRVHPWLKLR